MHVQQAPAELVGSIAESDPSVTSTAASEPPKIQRPLTAKEIAMLQQLLSNKRFAVKKDPESIRLEKKQHAIAKAKRKNAKAARKRNRK